MLEEALDILTAKITKNKEESKPEETLKGAEEVKICGSERKSKSTQTNDPISQVNEVIIKEGEETIEKKEGVSLEGDAEEDCKTEGVI